MEFDGAHQPLVYAGRKYNYRKYKHNENSIRHL
jgi:hypothetical protein